MDYSLRHAGTAFAVINPAIILVGLIDRWVNKTAEPHNSP
jgi:hypothetical protein